MDKILIVAAKIYNDPTGGGGTVVKNLIDTFVEDYKIDLLLYRTPISDVFKHKNLNTQFRPILFRNPNKFERRILNYANNLDYLKSEYNLKSYKKIIIVHISKMFGFEKLDDEILNKTILFPMYLSPAYKRSNESVPINYTALEYKTLKSIKKIITPSQSEKDDLINLYNVDCKKINIINRGVSEFFLKKPRKILHIPIRLIVVSAIKQQKNVIEAVRILKKLLDSNLACSLKIIGRIESRDLYDEIIQFIHENNLINEVGFIEGLNLLEVSKEMEESDILILPSLWETFGRVVYEGMSTGLPVIIKDGIECFSNLYNKNFIFSYKSIKEAAEVIMDLVKDPAFYGEISAKSISYAKQFSAVIEKELLKEVILCQD